MQRSPLFSGKLTAWAALIMGLLFSSGCSTLSLSRRLGLQYYLIDIPECAQVVKDQEIINCKTRVVSILRERMNNARLGRTAGGLVQVVTAAASAMFTGTTGTSALATATILSGTSAIVPELSNVIEAKERAEVYNKGVNMIDQAYAQYLEQISSPGASPLSNSAPSPEGAALYGKIVSAVQVVESGLVGQLPTLEELQKASPSPLDVSTNFIELTGESREIKVTRGGPVVTAISDQEDIATVAILEGGNTIKISPGKAEGKKNAILLLKNGSGGIAKVTVKVSVAPLHVSTTEISVPENEGRAITVMAGGPIIEGTFDPLNADVATREISEDGLKATVKGKKSGTTRFTLFNASGGSAEITVTVTAQKKAPGGR